MSSVKPKSKKKKLQPRRLPKATWLTALSFAMVGSFEEAIDNWRVYAQRFPNDNDGVILAATAGAINVRLGERRCAGAEPVMAKRVTKRSGSLAAK